MKTRRRLRGLYAPELLESRIAPATFLVTSLADDASAGTLRDVIQKANLAAGADTVTFQKGLTGTINVLNTEIAITDTLTIKGPGIDLITVSGGDARRIFNIDDGNADPTVLHPATISGLTFLDGKSAGSGGAIYGREPLTLTNVVVAGSYATTNGGGIFVKTAGKIAIASSRFTGNYAKGGSGGLYLNGGAGITVSKTTVSYNLAHSSTGGLYARTDGAKSTIVITSCIIANNSSDDNGGGGQISTSPTGKATVKSTLISGNVSIGKAGGLYLQSGNFIIDGCTISGNSADQGGGLGSTSDSLVIKNTRFSANQATDVAGPGGGALYLRGAQPVTISGSVFAGNTSVVSGGAIVNKGATVLTITKSTFIGNSATVSGGAIALHDGAVFTMKGSTLSGNHADNFGGALFADTAVKLTATGNKFTENQADMKGGAIHTEGVLANAVTTVLAGNLFFANVAYGGGAISTSGAGSLAMKGDKVLGNLAEKQDGGGLYLANLGGITLTGLLVQGNQAADDAGGIRLVGNATLTSCKVLENVGDFGDGFGGGIEVDGGVTVAISKCTVTGNAAATGGGIYSTVGATTTVPGSTIKGNSARVTPNSNIP